LYFEAATVGTAVAGAAWVGTAVGVAAAAGFSAGVVGAAGSVVGAAAGAQDAITNPATPAADICKNLRRLIICCDIYFLLKNIERFVSKNADKGREKVFRDHLLSVKDWYLGSEAR